MECCEHRILAHADDQWLRLRLYPSVSLKCSTSSSYGGTADVQSANLNAKIPVEETRNYSEAPIDRALPPSIPNMVTPPLEFALSAFPARYVTHNTHNNKLTRKVLNCATIVKQDTCAYMRYYGKRMTVSRSKAWRHPRDTVTLPAWSQRPHVLIPLCKRCTTVTTLFTRIVP